VSTFEPSSAFERSPSFEWSQTSAPPAVVPSAVVAPPFESVVATLRAAGCVFAEEEARLLIDQAQTPDQLDRMVAQRVGGLPLEQVLGWAQFCGLRVEVGPGVFVPRRRTELLAGEAARLAGQLSSDSPLVVVDLCCGSGALGAAVAASVRRPFELYAVDIDPTAVQYARRNLAPFHGEVHQGDLFDALPVDLRGKIDILIANVPYVPTEDIALLPAEARDHEPLVALDGGGDGLDVMRAVARRAPRWLAPRGQLLVEASERQLEAAMRVMVGSGLSPRVILDDDMEATAIVAGLP
jgi:release factor glutamine methyltransferase